MTKILRLFMAMQVALLCAISGADARMSFDGYGTSKLYSPGLRKGLVSQSSATAPTPLNRLGELVASGDPGYATVGQAFSYAGPTIGGGIGPYTHALMGATPDGFSGFASGRSTLPTGLAFNTATGGISGTATANGFFWGWIVSIDALGRKAFLPISLSAGPAVQQVAASGDTTGVTDTNAINTILAAGGRARLTGTFYLNTSLRPASNSGLVLANGFEARLIANANVPMLRNLNQGSKTRTDTNILIYAEGSAFWNGKFGAQTRQSPDTKVNSGFLFISVDGMLVKPGKVTSEITAIANHGNTHIEYQDVELASDGVLNQDGIDIFRGSSNIWIKRTTGRVDDDVFSWAAKVAQSNVSILANTPWSDDTTYSPTLDIHSIFVDGAAVQARDENFFRFQRGNGFQLRNLRARNVEGVTGGAPSARRLVTAGQRKYVNGALTDPSIPWDIEIEGAKGFDAWLAADADMNGLWIRKIEQNIPLAIALGVPEAEGSDYRPDVRAITVDGVVDTYSGVHSTVVNFPAGNTNFPAGSIVDGLTLKNISLGQLSRFNNTLAPVTNLTIDGVQLGTATNGTFNGVAGSTGTMKNFTIANPNPITYATSTGLKLGPNVPKVRPFDAIPQTVAGSAVRFTNGTSPVGTYQAQGGDYVASGGVWILQGSLTNVPYPDAQVFWRDTFTETPVTWAANLGTSLASHTPEKGGAYTTLNSATNTTPARINDVGDGIFGGANGNGYRAGTASPGLNYRITGTLEYKGARAADIPVIGGGSVANANTLIQARYNRSGNATYPNGCIEFFKFVGGVSTPLYQLDKPFESGQMKIGYSSTVDNLVNPTKRFIQLEVDLVSIGPVFELNVAQGDTALIQVGSGATGNGGAPLIKFNQPQNGSTGRQFIEVQAETF